jgi:hypothetical protein
VFISAQAAYLVLKKWNQNTAATKRQIGIWHHYRQETEGNDLPMTGVDVERMKAFLRRNAPASYFELFAKEETDR